MSKAVEIQGSTLEGGGQVVRISVGLSALTGIPIHLFDIRVKRPGGGGLGEQHLTAVEWLGKASNAKLTGAVLKSRNLVFEPQAAPSKPKMIARAITIDLGNPGALTLVLQAILPYLIFTPRNRAREHYLLTFKGGTNIVNQPSADYVVQVLFPNLERLGLPPMRLAMDGLKRGWAFGGSRIGFGSATFEITPLASGAQLPAFNLKRDGGVIKGITATILAHGKVRTQMRAAVLHVAKDRGWDEKIKIVVDEDSGHPKHVYLLLVAEMEGGLRLGRDWLYDKKFDKADAKAIRTAMRELVEHVAQALQDEADAGGAMDEWMEDQVVIFQGLAKGRSWVESGTEDAKSTRPPSLHALGARWLVGEIQGVEFDDDGACEGIGFIAGVSGGKEELERRMTRLGLDAQEE